MSTPPDRSPSSPLRLLAIVGPGVLVAATGVGTADLANAGIAGSKLGLAIGWAVLIGAILKFVVSENLARWQIATGETVLGGALRRFGPALFVAFGIYLVGWSVFVGTALASACGVTLDALIPGPPNGTLAKFTFGSLCSVGGAVLVWVGGFRLFARVMAASVGIMVLVTITTAVISAPDLGAFARGLVVPTIPGVGSEDPAVSRPALAWTIAVFGGVGGTLTLIAYSYWMHEAGRSRPEDLRTCRIDLATGYVITAAFGVAMVVIGHRAEIDGKGINAILALADSVESAVGARFGDDAARPARYVFLIGTLAAVFSSLLGVWQVVPVIFADWWRHRPGAPIDTAPSDPVPAEDARPARGFLIWLSLASIPGLWYSFQDVQKWYGIVGACFVPALAAVLLVLNGNRTWVGTRFRNRLASSAILMLTFLLLIGVAIWDITGRVGLR